MIKEYEYIYQLGDRLISLIEIVSLWRKIINLLEVNSSGRLLFITIIMSWSWNKILSSEINLLSLLLNLLNKVEEGTIGTFVASVFRVHLLSKTAVKQKVANDFSLSQNVSFRNIASRQACTVFNISTIETHKVPMSERPRALGSF